MFKIKSYDFLVKISDKYLEIMESKFFHNFIGGMLSKTKFSRHVKIKDF